MAAPTGRSEVGVEAGWSALDVLVEAARPRRDDRQLRRMISGLPDELVFEAARHHRVVSVVHERLRGLDGVSDDLVRGLARYRLTTQALRLHLRHARSVVGGALDVPWLLVKGEVLANCYDDPSLRDFNDLDLVVRPHDFGRALESLIAVGVSMIGENWQGYRSYEVAEIPLQLGSSWIDLHWHVVALGSDRRWIDLPTEALFERAVPTRLGEETVLRLDPVDTLLHLCVNLGLGGGRRLRGLLDVDAVISNTLLDIDEFVRRARAAGVGALAATMLQRTSAVLGTEVPESLLRMLGSRTWLALNRLATRRPSPRKGPTAPVAPGLLLRSSRDTAGATALALAQAARRSAAEKLGRSNLTEAGGPLDWQRRPPDGHAADHRRDYLSWVATLGRHWASADDAPDGSDLVDGQ